MQHGRLLAPHSRKATRYGSLDLVGIADQFAVRAGGLRHLGEVHVGCERRAEVAARPGVAIGISQTKSKLVKRRLGLTMRKPYRIFLRSRRLGKLVYLTMGFSRTFQT